MLKDEVLNPQSLLDNLLSFGATSLPLMFESDRFFLAKEAKKCYFVTKGSVVGKADVRQNLSACESFEEGSPFIHLKREFCSLLQSTLGGLYPSPFAPELDFNEMSLQKYPPNSIGITPHIDSHRCHNLICVFVLEGDGKFYLCDNRDGDNPREIHAPPGYVIIMVAKGFCGKANQQFHFLSDIKTGRLTFGLRQVHPLGKVG